MQYTDLALVAAVVLAAWMVWRSSSDEESYKNLDPKVEQGINRKVAENIKSNWDFYKKRDGYDKPVATLLKWYGHGTDTYGCNRADANGNAKNYRMCKRWTKLNNHLFKQYLQDIMYKETAGRGCNTDGLSGAQEDNIISIEKGKCKQVKGSGYVYFPWCTCKDGIKKNSNGVPICSGGGSCV